MAFLCPRCGCARKAPALPRRCTSLDHDRDHRLELLADAETHFVDGVFAGLKLIGFAIWERRTGAGRNVTFPARQYSVNGERRSFALFRPVADTNAQDAVRDLILSAHAEYEQAA